MMVSQGGFGSTTSADSVKAVYRQLFGVQGTAIDPKTSVLPNGVVPVKLPVTTQDGRILPPGSALPKASATATPAAPLGSGSGSGVRVGRRVGSGSPPAALPPPPPVYGSGERGRTQAGGP